MSDRLSLPWVTPDRRLVVKDELARTLPGYPWGREDYSHSYSHQPVTTRRQKAARCRVTSTE